MKEKSEFSFCVLAYNQENTIVETLESIKYQIQHFGSGRDFNLYITDDASKDSTLEIVSLWLKVNNKLFKKIEIKSNENNVGTVCNYNYLMSKINTEEFKIIAGDDLIGPYNIFKFIGDDEDKIYTFPYVRLDNDNVDYRLRYLYDYYYKKIRYKRKFNCTWMRLGDFLHTPSTFYAKKMYTISKSKQFNAEFYLYEDDPTFYSFFLNNEIKVNLGSLPLILYRYTAQSTSTVPNKVFLNDWKKLQKMYISDSKGIERFYLVIRNWSYFKCRILYKIIERVRQLYRIIYVEINDHSGFFTFKNQIECSKKEFADFYKKILILSNRYKEK